jgi:hypothetical protein
MYDQPHVSPSLWDGADRLPPTMQEEHIGCE